MSARRFAPGRLDRLIGTRVLGAVALVWALLVSLDAFSAFARELDEIGRGDYTLGSALAFTAWTLPRRAYELFGTSVLIGGILGLGALAPTAELTAMRAAGMSMLRICLAAVGAVALLMLVVIAIGETLGPLGERRAQDLAARAQSKDLVAMGRTGLWAREGTVLVNAKRAEIGADGVTLHDVRLYEFTERGQLLRISLAARAEHAGGHWALHDVVQQRFDADAVRAETWPRLTWDSTLDPRLLTISVVRPRYLPASDLLASIAYMQRNGLDAAPFESALWQRAFYPVNVLVLLLAALPFAFGTLRSGGLAKRLFLGVLLAVGWFLLQRAVVNLAEVYGVDFRLAHGLPALLLGLAAAAWFARGR